MFVLSPQDVLEKGLGYVKAKHHGKSAKSKQELFQKHFGSSQLDLANIWYDLLSTEPPIPGEASEETKKLLLFDNNEKSERGFKMFMAANYFLWAYDKNATLLSTRFGICERNSWGQPLWKWIMRIAALKAKKIVWPDYLDNPETELLAVTIDGVDFNMNEVPHPEFNVDTTACSRKTHNCATKYEITIAVHHAKCVHLAGPFKGGTHDLTMFRQGGMKNKMIKMRQHKPAKAIVDKGYRTDLPDEQGFFAIPDNMDSKALHTFKTRSRLRHKSFNARIKYFAILCDKFRHKFHKHGFALEAVVVIVQYQMDNGSPIYKV